MKFSQNGSLFRLAAGTDQKIHDTLPGGVYTIMFHPEQGWFLLRDEDFELPDKVYGNITRQRDRIISTFLDRSGSTGALFAGEKGSGKSLLAKAISHKLAKSDVPTLLVNNSYGGDSFAKFLSAFTQPTCVLFDEFEKTYDDRKGEQDALLTLMDGVYTSKKLFLLTCNDKYRINQHMKNRPGRLFYFLEFGSLDSEFVKEYANDNLRENLKTHVPKLVALADSFDAFNFDMLKAVIEEMNRYSEAPKDALSLLNIKPDGFARQKYGLRLFIDGKELPKDKLKTRTWAGDPTRDFRMQVTFRWPLEGASAKKIVAQAEKNFKAAYGRKGSEVNEEEMKKYVDAMLAEADSRSLTFSQDDFKRMDAVERSLVYVKGEGSSDEDEYLDFGEKLSGFKTAELRMVRLEVSQMEQVSPYEYL